MNVTDTKPRTGLISLGQLRSAVEEDQIRAVTPVVPDMHGFLKGKRVTADLFLNQLDQDEDTVGETCAYLLATDRRMTVSPAIKHGLMSWSRGFEDMSLKPDLDTIRLMPHTPGVALVHCDAVDTGGKLLDIAPRQMLRTQLSLLEAEGYEIRIGWESEFLLHHGQRPVTRHNADYALNLPPGLSDFFRSLEEALLNAETPPEAFKGESAPGQLEVTFPYGEAMRACDNYTVYRQTLQHIAEQRGMRVNFMAAPTDETGSGLHLHLSLWRDNEPVFATGRGDDLPQPMVYAIGGLLAGLPDLAPLWAPVPNSYKRFRSHSFAPQYMNWGYDHRGCAVRITGHGRGRHLELRVPGADANPYLVATAATASLVRGLGGKTLPPRACTGDAYHDYGCPRIHRDLVEGLRAFMSSDFSVAALGTGVLHHYGVATQHEIDVHRTRVTDVERERGDSRA
ncbi:glutamine synthetase family protein [Streptomyces tauricus]|uniref:glutamine synthetase family protein n=1 Tax=Streptomyces tauricus TaxID=68274 RepID=UPI002243D912|nr:glutamine synthetase family protein [Streptomyces tauricus]MCW8101694.1 glutamine synthetase family protein [Streptomyces tauricus]